MKHPRLAVAAAVLTLAVGASVAVAYARGDIEFAWEYDDAPAPRPIAAVAPSLPAKPPKPPSAETPPAPAVVTDLSVTGASPVSPALDAFIRERMARAGAPGLAAAVVRDHRLVWTAGFGAADLARGAPVTPDTLFILASLSKPVTATALMQLCEQGRFGLDDDINRLLPFRVRNPRYPDRPITARMLLTHTSSIHDDDVVDELVVPGDSPVSLRRFVEGYFVPGGEFYHDTNFARRAPGAGSEYSNAAVTLAGYLVEALAGVSFEAQCQRGVFAPLGMSSSAWRLAGLDPATIAMPYSGSAAAGFTPLGQYGFPDIPDGALRTSARQLTRFLLASMDHGRYGDARVLRDDTVDEMRRVQNAALDADQGLVWSWSDLNGRRVIGHNGAYRGASTDMNFDPTTGVGVMVLTNGEAYFGDDQGASDALTAIEARLFDEAPTL